MRNNPKFIKYIDFLENDRRFQKKLEKLNSIFEIFDTTRTKKGTIRFKQSDVSDKHIQDIIEHVSATSGVPKEIILAKMQKTLDRLEKYRSISPILYETMAQNAAETAAFDEIEHSKRIGNVKFEESMFYILLDRIKREHAGELLPMRSYSEPGKYLNNINPIFVPSDKKVYKKYDSVGTAAATPDGKFIFNKEFMQKLLSFAAAEGLKPKGKKYICNGGDIPDEYAYIEFLILHEFLHYIHGDFAAGRRNSQFTPKEHNWASDFRSNYELVKAGYSQIPMGLFNDDINMDRMSYYEMVKLVHDELQKIKDQDPEAGKEAEDILDDSTDEHDESEGDPGDPSNKEGKPGDKEGSGEGNQDEKTKDIRDKLGKRKEQETAEDKSQNQGQGSGSGQSGKSGKGGGDFGELSEIKKHSPQFDWRRILAKLIASYVKVFSTSYLTPSRNSANAAYMGKQLGVAPIKPGIRKTDQRKDKLILVFDTSGSMHHVISTVLSEAENLLKTAPLDAVVGVAYFANSPVFYEVNTKKDYYAKLDNFSELGKSEIDKRVPGYGNLLGKAGGGGTDFSKGLSTQLNAAAGQEYNIMIFSDNGILDGGNYENFYELYCSHRSKVFFIADSKETYNALCTKMNEWPTDQFTHL